MNEEGMRAGFALHGDKGTVRFEVRGYEFPNPEEDPHSEWFDGVFSAEIGPWSGSFRGTVLASDLRRLAEELEGALAQPGFKASFDPIEPHLVFEIEDHAGKRGATEARCPERWRSTAGWTTSPYSARRCASCWSPTGSGWKRRREAYARC